MSPVTTVRVDSDSALREAASELRSASRIALDTEFMRVDTYYPRLCLVQLGIPGTVFCVDPLAVGNLAPLAPLLAEPLQAKLMHAARQDLEALQVQGGLLVAPIVDTQVAAALLGLPEQAGYAYLVEHCCGIVLDKTQTRTDWAQRPLSEAQWHYAAQDVVWLEPVLDVLLQRLDALGRRHWLAEECARLAPEETPPPWQRLKGLAQWQGRDLAVAQALAEWREALAQRVDRPRAWLLRDETLYALARQRPATTGDLARLPAIAPGTVRRYGEELLEVVRTAARERAPRPHEAARLEPAQAALAAKLAARVRDCAAALGIAPTTLANRRDLERLASGQPVPRLASGWRREVLGDLATV